MDLTTERLVFRPRYFILQWHITERCNWHCRHCYQEENYIKEELPFDKLLKIFRQYLDLIKYFGTLGPQRTRLSLTGGEPLLRKDFFLFLEKIYKYNKYFYLSILSNGSLLIKENAHRLKSLGVRAIQVSLEGMEKNNDAIRGQGAFQKTIRAIEILVESKINVSVSFTLTKQNILDVLPLVKLCEELGVWRIGIRRLVPIGRGSVLKDNMLSPRELRKIYFDIEKKRRELKTKNSNLRFIVRGCEESILSQDVERPLSFCGVIDGRALVILPSGDVIPCRRLPIKIGNVLEKDLLMLYYGSQKLKHLRNLNNAHQFCKKCFYFGSCLSGAKCISYAYFKKLYLPDPQCWRIFRELPKPDLFKRYEEKISRSYRVHPHLFMGTKIEKDSTLRYS